MDDFETQSGYNQLLNATYIMHIIAMYVATVQQSNPQQIKPSLHNDLFRNSSHCLVHIMRYCISTCSIEGIVEAIDIGLDLSQSGYGLLDGGSFAFCPLADEARTVQITKRDIRNVQYMFLATVDADSFVAQNVRDWQRLLH